jgi:hypothetical protein
MSIFPDAYGGDPGRDEIMFTEDDLDYAPVIDKVASEGISVLAVDYGGSYSYANFEYIATHTGGIHYTSGTNWQVDIATEIENRIGTGRGDVAFIIDLTGSMSGNFVDLKTKMKSLIDLLPATLDVAFGLGTFVDYPGFYDSYGYAAAYGDSAYGDYAWRMNLDITTDRTLAKSAIDSDIPNTWTYWGGDGPQCYSRALFESQFFSWRTAEYLGEYTVTAYAYPEEADDEYFPDNSPRSPIQIIRENGSIITVWVKVPFLVGKMGMRMNGGGIVNDNPQGYNHLVQAEWRKGVGLTGRFVEVDKPLSSIGKELIPYRTIAIPGSERKLKYGDMGYFVIVGTGERYEFSVDDRLSKPNYPKQIDLWLGVGKEAFHKAMKEWGVREASLYIYR